MPKRTKAQKRAVKRYYKKHDFVGPLTEAQENAAYEADMRRKSGGKDPAKAFQRNRIKIKD